MSSFKSCSGPAAFPPRLGHQLEEETHKGSNLLRSLNSCNSGQSSTHATACRLNLALLGRSTITNSLREAIEGADLGLCTSRHRKASVANLCAPRTRLCAPTSLVRTRVCRPLMRLLVGTTAAGHHADPGGSHHTRSAGSRSLGRCSTLGFLVLLTSLRRCQPGSQQSRVRRRDIRWAPHRPGPPPAPH